MKFRCVETCYFMSSLWENGDLVQGPEFAHNKHFQPVDDEAVEEVRALGREVEDAKPEDEFIPDPDLMLNSVTKLRELYPSVEWKVTMRKPEFVRAIMESGQWQAK